MRAPEAYRERRSVALPATVWTRTSDGSAGWVLPDGCLDVLWDGEALAVAGPDTRPEVVCVAPGTRYAALRFDPGVGPAVIGVPAHAVRDEHVALADLLPAAEVDRLTAALLRAAEAPVGSSRSQPHQVLERWAADRLAGNGLPDPAMARAAVLLGDGRPVAEVADALGAGERTLHRRSLTAFGYGPKVLARILRFQRALGLARGGLPLAHTAAEAGYADQAHLAREARALGGRPLTHLLAER